MLKYLLLALLADQPRHGYELKCVFEELLGGTWPLQIAQVYTSLGRLDRDGLVAWRQVSRDQTPDRKVYSLTDAGRTELQHWLKESDGGPVSVRDEGVLKVLAAMTVPGADATAVIWAQRDSTMRSLSELHEARDAGDLPLATTMLLDAGVERMRATLRWLDRCEARLERRNREDR